MNKLLILISIGLLVSCTSKYEVSLPKTDLEIHISDRSQESVTRKKCMIQYNSEQYQNIKNWFAENQYGWESRPATYFTKKSIGDGKGFNVGISGGRVVIGNHMTRPSDKKIESLISCL